MIPAKPRPPSVAEQGVYALGPDGALVRATDAVDMVPDGPLWPGLVTSPIAIIAIETHPAGGEARWAFDFADSYDEAHEKLRHWNDRAAREWPELRFTLKEQR